MITQEIQAAITAGAYLSSCNRRNATPGYDDLYDYLATDWPAFEARFPEIGGDAAIEMVYAEFA